MSALAAEAVTLELGGRRILAGVSFVAQPGEFIALIGPNGAGKSSLLTLLAGLIAPGSGRVLLDGVPLASLRPAQIARRRAWLPQNPRCDWPIAVERLVALGLTPTLPVFGDLTAADRRRVDAALAACDLTARRTQPATTLSGGELARAMLARALVGDPGVLLVDEPMAGLDPRHAIDTARRLRSLALTEGRLVVAAMHDLTLAVRHATRVLALADGQLCADGPPAEAVDEALLRRLFDVDAAVRSGVTGSYVDYG